MLKRIKNKYYGYLAILATQMFLFKSAFAQSIGFTPPPASDMSRQFINQIFGGLVDGGRDAFGGAIATFNGAALVVGGILVAYTILAGTIGTAHDGEMLGKKFSSVWVPVRTALGTALVMPVLPGGYCVMQGLVMWLIMQGVSLGNMVWSSYTTGNANQAVVALVSKSTKESIHKFAQDIYLAHVCLEAKKAASASSPPILSFVGLGDNYAAIKAPGQIGAGFGEVYFFGNHGVNTESKSSCGRVDVPKDPVTPSINTVQGTTVSSSVTALNNLQNSYRSADLSGIINVHKTSLDTLVTSIQPIAARAVQPNNNVTEQEIRVIADAYISDLVTQAQTTSTSASMLNAANQQGWFLAGTWITRIISAQNKLSSAINTIPEYSINIKPVDSTTYADVYKSRLSNGFKVLSGSRPELIASISKSAENGEEEESVQEISGLGYAGKIMASMVTGIDLETVKNETRHPLLIMTSIGDRILTAIIGGMLVSLGIAAVSTNILAKGVVDATTIFIAIYGTLAFPLAAFIGVGGMLSYILPNTPFLIWLGIIIGWTIMVVEAVLAAPLWAIMHLHPNGDDMTGKGGNGYMLVLGLLLRPALIIFGLIAAIIFSDLFGQLLNRVFFEVFSGSITSGGLGFFAMIFGTALYGTAMFMIIKNTFALMHIIPDQMMRWIGGGGEQLGQYANQVSDGAAMKGAAAAGAGIGYMAKDGLQNAGQGLGQIKQLAETKRGADEQKKSNLMQQETGYSQSDRDTGMGSGDINRSIDKEFGDSKMGAAQAKADFTGKSEMLGGGNTESALQYRQNLMEGMSKGQSFQEASESSFSKAYNDKYGSNAFQVADTIAKGDSNNGQNQNMYNLALQRTTGMMNEKMAKIEASGESDPKSKMSEMFGKAIELNNQGTNMKSAIKQASSSLNSTSSAPAAAASAPVADNSRMTQTELDFGNNDNQQNLDFGTNPQRDLFNNDDNNGDKR